MSPLPDNKWKIKIAKRDFVLTEEEYLFLQRSLLDPQRNLIKLKNVELFRNSMGKFPAIELAENLSNVVSRDRSANIDWDSKVINTPHGVMTVREYEELQDKRNAFVPKKLSIIESLKENVQLTNDELWNEVIATFFRGDVEKAEEFKKGNRTYLAIIFDKIRRNREEGKDYRSKIPVEFYWRGKLYNFLKGEKVKELEESASQLFFDVL